MRPLFVFVLLLLGTPHLVQAADKGGCAVSAETIADWLTNMHTKDPAPPWQRFSQPSDGSDLCPYYTLGWESFVFLMSGADSQEKKPRFLTWMRGTDAFPGLVQTGKRSQKGNYLYGLSFLPSEANEDFKLPVTGPINKTGVLSVQAKPQFALYNSDGSIAEYSVRMNKPQYDYLICQNLFTQGCFDQRIQQADQPLEWPRTSPKKEGAVELKAAWLLLNRENNSLCDTGNFFCTPGTDQYGRSTLMALVGLHIVIFHEDVPSGIWITFEHRANSPNCQGGANLGDYAHWTFNTAPSNAKDWTCEVAGFLASSGPNSVNICQVGANGVPVGSNGSEVCNCRGSRDAETGISLPFDDSPTNVCRVSPLTNESRSINETMISHLSNAVPLLSNYRLIGVVWEDPDDADQSMLLGSTGLSNTVMETYVQTLISEPLSCLGCHEASGPTTKNPNPALNDYHNENLVNSFDRSFLPTLIDNSTLGYCPSAVDLPSFCKK